ncbi:hypothetical protein FRACA_670015 [Frankia canadensis]|uniref:Uncharacterized protein n=1 Tax=Frankia canadensis TaxID=1836972 RepID=A0A2I2L067_9ACTN|nr:hypothetical protein FRACA_670015 [Frankia canadensis]SOU58598.1 hypothetical protein FRACA_670015 [Frankia canadensis]
MSGWSARSSCDLPRGPLKCAILNVAIRLMVRNIPRIAAGRVERSMVPGLHNAGMTPGRRTSTI